MASIQIIKWSGRFGNNCVQLAHAVYLAQELGVKHVKHPPHHMFRSTIISSGADDGDHPGLSGIFYHGESLRPHALPMTFRRRKSIFLNTLFPELIGRNCLGQTVIKLLNDESTLVIHVRSGDVFNTNPHPGYVQPPLWYYQTIIENCSWNHIILVCENTLNPVIDKLCSIYPIITLQKSSLLVDFTVLYNAKNLVGSNGTFTNAAFCFNNNIRNYWIPSFMKSSSVFAQAYPLKIILIGCPGYIEVGKWENTLVQRQKMLAYKPEG